MTRSDRDICTAVWDASPSCTGWVKLGHPLHGCKLTESGHREHLCPCGSKCHSRDVLPAPRHHNGRTA